MCTAISYKTNSAYFGRNLDLERGYGERVVVTPRNFKLCFRCEKPITSHYAFIGMAAVANNYPLYFEATNEKGLSMAGLNFFGNAVYFDKAQNKQNITPFEFIPYVLSSCQTINDAKSLINNINLVNIPFSLSLPLSPLHFMISDKTNSIVVESVKDGIKVYDNPFEVLTNNPTFDYHLTNINNYMSLGVGEAKSQFNNLPFYNYSLGMGALGLPGDFSSASRFVRAVFVKENSVCESDEESSVTQFFHILSSVSMPKGCVLTKNGFEYTRYSSCCNADAGVYYFTTYHNPQITAVDMHQFDLDSSKIYEIK